MLHQFQAGTVGQAHVGQAQVEGIPCQQGLGLGKVLGAAGVEFHPAQGDVQEFADVRFVIDDQDSLP